MKKLLGKVFKYFLNVYLKSSLGEKRFNKMVKELGPDFKVSKLSEKEIFELRNRLGVTEAGIYSLKHSQDKRRKYSLLVVDFLYNIELEWNREIAGYKLEEAHLHKNIETYRKAFDTFFITPMTGETIIKLLEETASFAEEEFLHGQLALLDIFSAYKKRGKHLGTLIPFDGIPEIKECRKFEEDVTIDYERVAHYHQPSIHAYIAKHTPDSVYQYMIIRQGMEFSFSAMDWYLYKTEIIEFLENSLLNKYDTANVLSALELT